jgi:hypothetical protein
MARVLPDPDTHPVVARLEKWALTKPLTFVEAQVGRPPRQPPTRPATERRSADNPRFDMGDWSGVVRLRPTGAPPISWVYGQFNVPQLLPIGADQSVIGVWVGLDGSHYLSAPGNTRLLQAGVMAELQTNFLGSPEIVYRPFVEWINAQHQQDEADQPCVVTNLDVDACDTVWFLVTAPSPNYGWIAMANMTKGLSTAVGVQADPGITWLGESAEWIVEQASPSPPFFSPVTFTHCSAGSGLHILDIHNANTDVTYTHNPDGTPKAQLTRTTITSPHTAIVEELIDSVQF